jgi:hypothetical protein
MTEETRHGTPHAGNYEIRVTGQLDGRWSARFGGLPVEPQADGTSVITAAGMDQAALHGLLQQLRDLGLGLISLSRVDHNTREAGPATAPGDIDGTRKETP